MIILLELLTALLEYLSKDEWNTKEDTGKSLKNTLHLLCGMLKGTSQAKVTKP